MVFWNKYCKVVSKLVDGGTVLAAGMLMFMSLLVTIEVICRGAFNISTLIADEYSCYACVALTFFGAAISFKSNSFINVDILYAKFSPTVRKWVDFFLNLLATAFIVYLFFRCTYVARYSYTMSVTSTSFSSSFE